MIAIVGIFTVCFYRCNRQQKQGLRVLQNKVGFLHYLFSKYMYRCMLVLT